MSSKMNLVPLSVIKQQANDLKVFNNHVYEYKKGVRKLILTTEKSVYRRPIEHRLTREKIDYAIQDVDKEKINVFFGELSPEQDFILGTLLGYDKVAQCDRYLKFIKKLPFGNKKPNVK